jgi:hypothetical protein
MEAFRGKGISMRFLFFQSIVIRGLALPAIPNAQERKVSEKEFKIQVNVEEVRIDAVVLDKKGDQITDFPR